MMRTTQDLWPMYRPWKSADRKGMRTRTCQDDRGSSLIGYALVVILVAVVGVAGIGYVGGETAGAFEAIGLSFDDQVADQPEAELTPKEKWQQAQADYKKTVNDAKAKKAYDLAAAKAEYDSAVAANQSLPKKEKNAANKAASNAHKAAKASANDSYKSSVASAKEAKAAAKAEYDATK